MELESEQAVYVPCPCPQTNILHYLSVEVYFHKETQNVFHQIGSYNCLPPFWAFHAPSAEKNVFVVLEGMVNLYYGDERRMLLQREVGKRKE